MTVIMLHTDDSSVDEAHLRAEVMASADKARAKSRAIEAARKATEARLAAERMNQENAERLAAQQAAAEPTDEPVSIGYPGGFSDSGSQSHDPSAHSATQRPGRPNRAARSPARSGGWWLWRGNPAAAMKPHH